MLELAGLIFAFILIGFLTYKGWKLHYVLSLASLAIIVTSGRLWMDNLGILYKSLTDPAAILLTLLVITISILGYELKETGLMEDLVSGFRYLFPNNRLLLMLLPSLVSMLTVPGGAILSAPMVAEAAESDADVVNLSLINIIYRHLFLLLIPYHTPLIFIAQQTGLNPFKIVLFNLPVTITGYIFAYYYIFYRQGKHLSTGKQQAGKLTAAAVLPIVKAISPFALIILLGFGASLYLPLTFFIGIIYTLAISLPRSNRITVLLNRIKLLRAGINWNVVLIILATMVFKTYIQEAAMLTTLIGQLLEIGVPLTALLVVIPLLLGLITGNTTAAIAITIPLLQPVLPGGAFAVASAALIFISGFCGYLGSPIHACLFLTVEYFKAPMFKTLVKVNIVAAVMLVMAVLVYLLH